MRKIILTGGPSTGKSTLFDHLRQAYPNAYFVAEAAEKVINSELAKQQKDPSYVPALPTIDYKKFAQLLITQHLKDEAAIPTDADIVFQDRCLIDDLGFLAHYGITDFNEDIENHIKNANFTMAFFCDWLDKFEQTAVRRETPEDGLSIHRYIEAAYHSSGIPVVHLPALSPDPNINIKERLNIIRTELESHPQ